MITGEGAWGTVLGRLEPLGDGGEREDFGEWLVAPPRDGLVC
jgi:hypothetical protein